MFQIIEGVGTYVEWIIAFIGVGAESKLCLCMQVAVVYYKLYWYINLLSGYSLIHSL